MEFQIDFISLKNFHVTLIEKNNRTLYFYSVDVFYEMKLIGVATSDGVDGVTIEFDEPGSSLHKDMIAWRGQEYTVDIITENGIPVTGKTHTDTEDVCLWIEGQIIDWIKDQFS